MSKFHLAQLNIAKMKFELDDIRMKDFVDNLDKVNGLAEQSPGFVWRLQTEERDATNLRVFDDNMLLVNLSVWETLAHLQHFVYHSFHLEILKRKQEWFDKMDSVHQVLWWIPAGESADLEESKRRLSYLQKHGESEYAFSFRKNFDAPEKFLSLPE